MSETPIDPTWLAAVQDKLKQSARIAALTGAGISAESGVPTFRGADGLWKKYRAEDLATPEAFARNPELVWEWYNWRRSLIAEKKPNPGHLALAALEKARPGFTLITQNVDGLHLSAGSRNVLEIHGSIWRVRCLDCGGCREDRTNPLPPLPRCPQCNGLLRPDVVWFGESLNPSLLEASFQVAALAEVMLVIGTSAIVQPAASLARQAKRSGAFVVEVNVEKTPLSSQAHAVLTGPSGLILPRLIEGLSP